MDGMIFNFLPNPSNDDFETMCQVMCPRNLIETELFVKVLKNTAKSFDEFIVGHSENLFRATLENDDYSEPNDIIHHLNEIIYRAPTNSKIFMNALVSRIVHFVSVEKYQMARNDILYYKSFDLEMMNIEVIVLVQTLMCVCLYMMREMFDARWELNQLDEYLELLSADQRESDELQMFLKQLEKCKMELMEPMQNIQFNIRSESFGNVSNTEFRSDWEVPFASNACEFVSQPEKVAGVYARREIAKGEVIISEDLEYFQFSTPFMNCSYCAAYREYLYNCGNCRYKSYCSPTCMYGDLNGHKHECYGYKIGLIQMLESAILFRCFQQAAQYLSPAIEEHTLSFGVIRDASVAWNFITKFSFLDKTRQSVVSDYLSRQPNCKLLSKSKWRHLIMSSFRLAVYVHNDTDIMKSYFGKLELTKEDSIKLIATIMFRLNVHIAFNSQKEQLQFGETTNTSDEPMNLSADVKRMTVNAFEYYSINAHSDFVKCFNRLQDRIQLSNYSLKHKRKYLQQQAWKQQQTSPMAEYIGKLIRFSIHDVEIKSVADVLAVDCPTTRFIEQHFSVSTSSNRCKLLSTMAQNFHKFMYVYFGCDESGSQDKVSLCPTLKRFNHSCAANIDIGFSSGKQCVGKTNRHVESGTELTVCHESVNFLEQGRSERQAMLREAGIICKCDICTMPASLEPNNIRNSILCAFCLEHKQITAFPGNCSECYADYEDTLNQYITFISYILMEINTKEENPKTSEKELAILYGTYNNYVTLHFSEKHDLRFSGVLSFVEFLTSNGFLSHASEVILSLHSAYYSYYVDSAKIYYRDVDAVFFNKIRRIMEFYMKNLDCIEIDAVYPKKLLAIISYILKRQEEYLDASSGDIEAYNNFLENCSMYYKWKRIVNSQFLMPKSLQVFLKMS